MTDDERARIESDAREKAELENRVSGLEWKVTLILKGVAAIATAIGVSIYNALSGGIFK